MLVSTASQGTLVVLPSGCNQGDNLCISGRGGTYDPTVSSTWSSHTSFELPIEQNLDIKVDALFGNDTLRLGTQGNNGQLAAQVIGAISNPKYYLGMLGVNPQPISFPMENSRSSYITSLKDQHVIPSVSIGYTAGAQYSRCLVDTFKLSPALIW